jgi:hypothetical protein
VSGLILLTIGHLGWFKEQDEQSDLVSMSLLFGSLLASLPLAIATLVDRSRGEFLPLNELGFLAISIALLATGVMFQLKSTTVAGTGNHNRRWADLWLRARSGHLPRPPAHVAESYQAA